MPVSQYVCTESLSSTDSMFESDSHIVRTLRYLFYFKLARRRLHEQPKHVATR